MKNKEIEEIRINRGRCLAIARKKYGISKYYLNKISGLGRPQIDSIENGSASYSIDSLIRYVESLRAAIKYRKQSK